MAVDLEVGDIAPAFELLGSNGEVSKGFYGWLND